MEDLRLIIIELKVICSEFLKDASHDMILDCSTRIFNSQQINSNRDYRNEENQRPQNSQHKNGGESLLATQKQIYFLKARGFDGDYVTLTKEEAKKLISQYKKEEDSSKNRDFQDDAI
jgi:hypothetical protein